MVLICDNEVNARTKALRKLMYESGFPCAAVSVDEIAENLPAKLIVCYFEAFDNIRRRPYDHIFAIVIGDGFVNSALNAVRVANEQEACVRANEYFRELFGIGKEELSPFGVLVRDSFFFAKRHMEIFGNIVEPTMSEYMIFKYLLAFSDENEYFSPLKIRKFCYVRELRRTQNLDGNISVHIHNLNEQTLRAYGKYVVRSKKFRGYYCTEKDQ